MKVLLPFTAALVLIAASASAGERERLAAQLRVSPETYTLNELIRIASVSGPERRQMIAAIDNNKAAFDARVAEAMTKATTRAATSPVRLGN